MASWRTTLLVALTAGLIVLGLGYIFLLMLG